LVDGIKVVGSKVLALGLLVGFTVGSKDGSCVLGLDIGIVTGLDVGSSVTASVGSSVVGNIVTGAFVFGSSVGKSVKNGAAVLDGFPGPDCGCFVGSIACCCGLRLGDDVGLSVGFCIGLDVGSSVVAAVGAAVGNAVVGPFVVGLFVGCF
jgi:hypothetical protein